MTLPTRSAPATSLSISRRLSRAAVEFLPPFAVALLILPYIIQYGKLIPWQPSTIDLQVYVYAVKDMLAGKDIFATTTPFWNLYFIYPPIAAILMTPLAFGPYVVLAGGLDRRPGLGPAVGAETLRRTTWLEAWAHRHCGGACCRADPDHARVRPGEHHADGTGSCRSAAGSRRGSAGESRRAP